MAWYSNGTVTVTNGSTIVTGAGTAFVGNVTPGQGFRAPNGFLHEIVSVDSATQLTISPAYSGGTAAAQSYAVLPLRGLVPTLTSAIGNLLNDYGEVVTGIGAGLFPDGNAAAPAFRFTNDQDSGFYRVGNNTIGIVTGGTLRATINGSGNVAINASADTGHRFSVGGNSQFGSQGTLYVGSAFSTAGDFINGTLGNSRWDGDNFVTSSFGNNHLCQLIFQLGTMRFVTSTSIGTGDRTTSRTDFLNLTRLVIEDTGATRPGGDNLYSLGTSGNRWSVVFAATGTINTSDERHKHWRGALNAAELRAAKRIIAELGIYQWNDAVVEKGEDGARLHFGVRAQQAFAIMEDEGLEWRRYAWCCHDEWPEQIEPIYEQAEGPGGQQIMRETGRTRIVAAAGDRYGIRPDQLAFWLIAAQAAIQADLEARLAALEAA